MNIRVFDIIFRNIQLIRRLGPKVILRFFKKRGAIMRYHLRGVGPISLRLDNSDLSTFLQVFEAREYDLDGKGEIGRRASRRYEEILAAGKVPVIIDAGANVGAASLWFSRTYPCARIVAIEPDTSNFEVLKRNTEQRPEIIAVHAAIAGEPGFVTMTSADLGWASMSQRSADGVPAITMAQAGQYVRNGISFIAKVDIEGFEKDLFAGDNDWIDKFHVIMIEPHDWMLPGQGTSQSFQAAMGRRNFEIHISGENLVYAATSNDGY